MENLVEKASTNQIKIGTILGYVALLISILYGLIITPWIIETIGEGAFGIYTLSNSIISMFLLDFGLSTTTNVFLSKYKANNDLEGEQKFLGVIFKLYFIISIVIFLIFLILFFVADYIYVGLTLEERADLKICLLITGLFSVVSFPFTPFLGILKANEKFIFVKNVEIINKILLIGLTIISIECGFGLYGLVAVHAIVGLISVALRIIFCVFKLPFSLKIKTKIFPEFKHVLSYSIWTAIISIFNRFIFSIMPSILGITSNSIEVGLFGIAMTIEGYIYTFGAIMSGLFLPKIGRIFESENYLSKLESLSEKVGFIEFIFVSFVIFGFISVGSDFLTIWLHNSDFYIVYFCIILISIHQLFYVPQTIMLDALFYVGKSKEIAFGTIVQAGINVALSFVLSFNYGALGAAISVFLSRIFETIYNNYLYRKYLKLDIFGFFKKTVLPPFLVLVVSIIIPIAIYYVFPEINVTFRFFIRGFIFVAGFSIIFILFFKKKIVSFIKGVKTN